MSCSGARTPGVAEPGTCAMRRSAPNSWPTLRRKEDQRMAQKERNGRKEYQRKKETKKKEIKNKETKISLLF
jgi:hypothetical protein